MNMTIFFLRKRFYVIVAVLVIGLILGGCCRTERHSFTHIHNRG